MTIGFAEIIRIIALNWMDVTRGPMGIPGIPPPQIGPVRIFGGTSYYYLFLTIAAASYLMIWLLVNSKIGRILKALREDATAAAASGVNVSHYQIMSFAIAALLAGFAGSLLVHFNLFVGPTGFNIDESLTQMNMAILGGLGSLPGSVLGAVILTVLPELFRVINEFRLLFMGVLMIGLMIWRPNGIMGKQSAVTYVAKRPGLLATLFKIRKEAESRSFKEVLRYAIIGD
jgi:branched-chain amino acid transport system permease protein